MSAAAIALSVYDLPPLIVGGVIWDRSQVLAMASNHCRICQGAGLRARYHHSLPCGCVDRSIFRACMRHYRYLSEFRILSRPSLIYAPRGKHSHYSFGRKSEEFLADVWLTAKRSLARAEWRVFELRFIRGLQWKECTRLLGMDRGNFFHALYRIENNLGRMFRELRPYPLFPIDQYFYTAGDHPADVHCKKPLLAA